MCIYIYMYCFFPIHILWLQSPDVSPLEDPFWRRWLSADTKMTMRATGFFQGCTRWLLPKIASNKFVELSPIQREENSEGSEDADAWSMLSRLLILGRWKINGWEIMVLAIGSEHLCDSISFFFFFFFFSNVQMCQCEELVHHWT